MIVHSATSKIIHNLKLCNANFGANVSFSYENLPTKNPGNIWSINFVYIKYKTYFVCMLCILHIRILEHI